MGIRSLLRNAFGRSRAAVRDEPSLPQQSAGPDGGVAPAVSVPAQPTAGTADRAGERIPDPGPLGPIPTPGPHRPEPVPQPEPEPTPMPSPKPIPEPEPVPTPDPNPVPEPAPGPDPEPAPAMAMATADVTAVPAVPAPAVPAPAPVVPAPATAPEATPDTAVPAEAVPEAAPPEAVPEAVPEAAPAEAVPEAAPAAAPAEAAPAAEGGAAISLEKVQQTAPKLVSLYKSAGVSLRKQGLAGQRAAVYLVLDRSGSMRTYYKDGTVQHLAEQALGLAANLDDDGVVPVVFFSTDVDGTAELDLTDFDGRIQELHESYGHMGRTNYHWAIGAVIDHYRASGATDPAFVIFQTDGAPYSKPAAERALCEAAKLPIFWQFVGFGDPEGKGFDFLRKLDDLPVPEKRVVDNAGFFHAGRDPRALADAQLYEELMVEFPEWLAEARAAGILP
ncbi:VWA domain-containing protein [Streptomyces cinnamoneus]|uniref:VWA domain-containing protein n=1 Tax=Streptomyces cinnamoneus TaxID=53446 RepID=UPI003406BCB1